MQHDIYSLGVCFLEIGLWESFVIYHDESGKPSPSTILKILNDHEKPKIQKASLIKNAFVDIARERLPRRMDDKYTEVVVTCLTCLDESNPEFEDSDGVLIRVRFIEKMSR